MLVRFLDIFDIVAGFRNESLGEMVTIWQQ